MDEKDNSTNNEANEDNSENKETDVTSEKELSGGETEKDGNYISKDEDSDVRVKH